MSQKGSKRDGRWHGDTVNNAGVLIDGAAVPGAGSSMGSFDENGVGATIIGSNGNGSV